MKTLATLFALAATLLPARLAMADDCDITVGDQVMDWVQHVAGDQSRRLAAADYHSRIFNAFMRGYDDQHERLKALADALDQAERRLRADESSLPSDPTEAAIARQHAAQDVLNTLYLIRHTLDEAIAVREEVEGVPSFEAFQIDHLDDVGRVTLINTFRELGNSAEQTLAGKYRFGYSFNIGSSGNVEVGPAISVGPDNAIALALAQTYPVFYVYQWAKLIISLFYNPCQDRFDQQMAEVREAFRILPSKLMQPQGLYQMFLQERATQYERFRSDHEKIVSATNLLDSRWRGLVALNALRIKTASAVLTGAKIQELRDRYTRGDPPTSIAQEAGVQQLAEDVSGFNSYLTQQQVSLLRSCGGIDGFLKAETLQDSLAYAKQAFTVYHSQPALFQIANSLETSLAWIDSAQSDLAAALQQFQRNAGPCAPANPRPALRSLQRQSTSTLRRLTRRYRHSLVGERAEDQIASHALSSASGWPVCALMSAGQVYTCGGAGTPYGNQFGNSTGNPVNDVLFSSHDGGYADDNRRVSTDIANARQNINDRIDYITRRSAAAESALPQWLQRNGDALNSGISALQASVQQQGTALEAFSAANATALSDAAQITQDFLQSPFSPAATSQFLSNLGAQNPSLPDIGPGTLPPDAPSLPGITAADRIYGNEDLFDRQVQLEHVKVEEQLPDGGAFRRVAMEDIRAAELFGKAGTPNSVRIAQELLKDAAALRFVQQGKLAKASVTTVSPDGTLGRADVDDVSNLPKDSLLRQVRQFDSNEAGIRARVEGLNAALTPDTPNSARRRDVLNVANQTSQRALSIFEGGSIPEAKYDQSFSTSMLDLVTNFVPLVNIGRSASESLTGRNAITGEDLDSVGRSLSVMAVVTLGIGDDYVGGAKIVNAIKEAANPVIENLVLKFGDRIYRIVGYVKELKGELLDRAGHLVLRSAQRELVLSNEVLNGIVDRGQPFFDAAKITAESLSSDAALERMLNHSELVYMVERSSIDPVLAAAIQAGTESESVVELVVNPEARRILSIFELSGARNLEEVTRIRLLGRYNQRFWPLPRM